ncbi:MAG: signal peptide peptidase SppA [Chitinophagales bacterium]|nr:signal peptide peptidase SppA [Chitinophagales bacterium]
MSFWKIFFGSLLAFVVGIFVVILFFAVIIGGIAATLSSNEPVTVKTNSVLKIDLAYEIPEQTNYSNGSGFSLSDFEPTVNPGLYSIVKSIAKAKDDANIKGIFLNFGYTGAGMATTEQIRNALLDFKKSGKFVVAYAEVYTERAYYLCSVADKVFVNPKGVIEFNGINAQYTFFKNLLDKIGVEPQIFYAGKFKSATEPFRLDSMSAPNKLMTKTLIDDIHDHVMQKISESRNLPIAMLDSVNDNFLVQSANDAVKYKIADSTYFTDQVQSFIKKQLKIEEKDKISYVTLENYVNAPSKTTSSVDDGKIAILFAQGDIVSGIGDEDNIGSTKYVNLLRKLRDDDNIKAIVFRVNSPGGSALASDVIAREVELTVKKKPVVVSMGDYAASGGYYISAFATKIIAQPNTLTGSIGVFGILPNMQKLFEDKLGINFDNVQTGKYSDLGVPTRALRPDEKIIIQNGVDSIYKDFKMVVMKGRNLDGAIVDSIAQGRVWTGTQGLKLGLVDTLGGIDEAIAMAAKISKQSKYRIVQYPEVDNKWYEIMKAFADNKETSAMKQQLGIYYPMYQDLKTLSQMNGVQARMMVGVKIE